MKLPFTQITKNVSLKANEKIEVLELNEGDTIVHFQMPLGKFLIEILADDEAIFELYGGGFDRIDYMAKKKQVKLFLKANKDLQSSYHVLVKNAINTTSD